MYKGDCMNIQLRKADGHHEKAAAQYKQIVENAIKKWGSIAAAARQAGMPPSNIHEALKRGSYLAIRNCAHKIVKAVKS